MTSVYSNVADKDGDTMNQYDYEYEYDYDDQAEQEWDDFFGLSEDDIEWLTSPTHSEEEWKERAKKEWLRVGYTEQEIDSLFTYDSITHQYYPGEKLKTRWDNRNRIKEKLLNLYLEAISLGVDDVFEDIVSDVVASVITDEEAEMYAFEVDSSTVDEDDDVTWREADHFNRIQLLSSNGFPIINFDSPSTRNIDTSHTIDGIKYAECDTLYHRGEEIGLFYDEISDFAKCVPHERHVEELLKIVTEHNIPLLLMYWEKDNKPIWEVYHNGEFVRQQPTMYSYEGYVYDQKRISRMSELTKEGETDIGILQQALIELNKEAEKMANRDEQQVRINENTQMHAELTEIVSKMQQQYKQLGFTFSQVNINNDGLDEMSHQSVCAALDSFAETIAPGLVASAYEEKARQVYPFYPNVSQSSQRYLLTAIALEEHLTAEHYDICPLYFELCRVFENELDVRIFSEYISKLVSIKDSPAAQWGGKEYCFKKIRELVSNAQNPNDRVFIPEKIKVTALHKVNTNIDKASIYQTILLDMLREKKFKVDLIEKEADFYQNCSYVEKRNKFVHPDDSLDAVALQAELEKIKKNTLRRLDWLIKATNPMK